ncbi:MAG: hypothetical protein RRB13_09390 [bacterium]|nr:hypothetical protein [bacterium]
MWFALLGLACLTPLAFHWPFFFGPKEELWLFRNDTLSYSYWWAYYFNKYLSIGIEPLWNPYVSLGYPAVAQISNTAYYPPAWILSWFFDLDPVAFLRLFSFYVVLHFSLGAGSAYLFLSDQRLSPLASFFGAMGWALSSAAQNATDGFEWLYGLAWFPLAVLFLLRMLKGQRRAAFYLGLVLGVLYSTNFLPVCYYVSVLLVGLALIYQWPRCLDLRFWGDFVGAQALAVLLAAPALLPLLQHVLLYSERVKKIYAYAMSGLNRSTVVDRFFSPMDYQIFQSAWFGFGLYLMVLVPIFFPAARPEKAGRWVLFLGGLILFGSGSYFLFADLFYLLLPGYAGQHWHHRTALYLGLPLALFAAKGLDFLSKRPDEEKDRHLFKVLFGFLALATALAMMTKPELIKRPELHGYFVVLILSVACWMWLEGRLSRLRPWVVVITVLELAFVFRLMNHQTAAPLAHYEDYQRGAAQIWAQEADRKDRYFQTPRAVSGVQHNLHNRAVVRGYVTPAMARTERFLLWSHSQTIWAGKPENRFLSEFIHPQNQDEPALVDLANGAPVFLVAQAQNLPLGGSDAVPLAQLQEMARSDLHQQVWLEGGATEGCALVGQLEVNHFDPNGLSLNAEVPPNCRNWLVWVDSWHPGWKAWVNGQRQEILRADFAFKGLALESGHHQIRFAFEPATHLWGVWLRRLGLLGSFLGLGWLAWAKRRA